MADHHEDGRRLCGQSDHDYTGLAHTILVPQDYGEVVVQSYSPIQQSITPTGDKENTPPGTEVEVAGKIMQREGPALSQEALALMHQATRESTKKKYKYIEKESNFDITIL